jgi:hypothetical protein
LRASPTKGRAHFLPRTLEPLFAVLSELSEGEACGSARLRIRAARAQSLRAFGAHRRARQRAAPPRSRLAHARHLAAAPPARAASSPRVRARIGECCRPAATPPRKRLEPLHVRLATSANCMPKLLTAGPVPAAPGHARGKNSGPLPRSAHTSPCTARHLVPHARSSPHALLRSPLTPASATAAGHRAALPSTSQRARRAHGHDQAHRCNRVPSPPRPRRPRQSAGAAQAVAAAVGAPAQSASSRAQLPAPRFPCGSA